MPLERDLFTVQQIIEKKKRTQLTAISIIYRLRKGIREREQRQAAGNDE